MSHFWTDLRYSLRRLRRQRGFTLAVVLTLALGLGANSAMFSVLYRTLLRPLPFPQPDRLMLLHVTSIWGGGQEQVSDWSYAFFHDLEAQTRSFSALAAFQALDLNLTGDGRPERLSTEVVSSAYFELLGASPIRGRTFRDDDGGSPGDRQVATIGYDLWQRRFGADPAIVGRTINFDSTSLTVVGVMPSGFRGLTGAADVWVPLAMSPVLYHEHALDEPWNLWLQVIGRLQAGTNPEGAAAELATLGPEIVASHPLPMQADVQWSATAETLAAARTDRTLKTAVVALTAAVGLVLLLACANLANLLLARSKERSREMALRSALGCARQSLFREVLLESTLLSVAAAGVGLIIAAFGPQILTHLRPLVADSAEPPIGFLNSVGGFGLDGVVVAFSSGLALLVVPLFGLIPAIVASRFDLVSTLKSAPNCPPGNGSGRHGLGLGGRGGLVLAEVAIALTLLNGAGLMLNSLLSLLRVDVGFDSANVLTFRIEPPRGRYPSGPAAVELQRRLVERLAALPGVEAVSVDKCAPLSATCPSTLVTALEGGTTFTFDNAPRLGIHHITPDYFRLLRARVLRGRGFDDRDRIGAPPVVLLNEVAARTLFGRNNPVGQRLALASGLLPREGEMAEVVGVVSDIRYDRPTSADEPAVYISALQYSFASTMLFVRTSQDPMSLAPTARAAIAEVDPDLPIFDVRTLDDRTADALVQARTSTLLLSVFAAIAVALAALGVYVTISRSVVENARGLAVRLALGAPPIKVRQLVIASAMKVTATGLVLGTIGAFVLARVIGRLLHEVSPVDVPTFGLAITVLSASALLAAWIPAWRATRLDPVVTLRSE